jgi:transcription initiation factor TFIID subunit TAF12
MTTIKSSTTTSTAYSVTADTTGTLVIQTGATPTTAVTVGTDQSVTLAGTLTTSSRGITKASMPSGSVLQVVNANYSTAVTNNTSTMASTGLTASITPTSATSKILVIASVAGIFKTTNNTAVTLQLYKNSGNIFQFALTGLANNSTANNGGSISTSFLDSPATTSSTSYTVYFGSQQNNAGTTVQLNGDTSTITLLEIAV